MTSNQFRNTLQQLNQLSFILPNGTFVPAHFHVTEVGVITRHFIDCGGTERLEKKLNFQLWVDTDYTHRLAPNKLASIVDIAAEKIDLNELSIEVEYQTETISKYGLDFDGVNFILAPLNTACLAPDKCGIPAQKPKVSLADINNSSCSPDSGCC